jgi:lysozyme family protein
MSKQFDMAFDRTLKFEGGYSDDPDDRGGKTKYGITETTWREFGGQIPVSMITLNEAKLVYEKLFWERGGVDRLAAGGVPQDLLNEMFDSCVNHGVKRGVKMLQEAYNLVRVDGPALKSDGVLGDVTFGAVCGFCGVGRHYCDALLAAIRCSRGKLYASLSQGDELQRKFIRGWMRRLV